MSEPVATRARTSRAARLARLVPLVVAVGQLPLLVIVPRLPSTLPGLLPIALVEGVCGLLLVAAVVQTEPRARGVVAFLLGLLLVGGVGLLAASVGAALWLVAGALLLTGGLAAYLLYRLSLVQLGLVDGGGDG